MSEIKEKENWRERTQLMLGEESVAVLERANVLIVGVGGVGAYVAEMLARAGVGNLTLVDGDVVSNSNRNRQLVALVSTVGRAKVDVLADRLRDINPQINLTLLHEFLRDERTVEVLESQPYDYVVDAIDTLAPKVFLLHQAVERGMRVVSSMGSGGKLDPMQVRIADISKSDYCKLARMVRKRLHRLGVRKGITVVYSAEVVEAERVELTEGEQNKKSNVGTISYMPAIFGCCLASHILRDLSGELKNDKN